LPPINFVHHTRREELLFPKSELLINGPWQLNPYTRLHTLATKC